MDFPSFLYKSYCTIIYLLCVSNSASAADLAANYSQNTILSAVDAPYHVISDIIIGEAVTMMITSGVEIIFDGDYTIEVKGSLNAGCSDRNVTDSAHIHIHSQNYDRSGGFVFDRYTDSDGIFCNVLFEGLYTVLKSGYSANNNSLVFNNCTFTNMWAVSADRSTTNYKLFTDCYFHRIYSIITNDCVIFRNCLFQNFNQSGHYSQKYVKIYNSTIIGPASTSAECIKLDRESVLEHSTIKNCDIALKQSGHYGTVPSYIRYNSFENNIVSVAIYGRIVVQFNNFIDDEVSIDMHSSNVDCNECNYNYFGIPSSNHSEFESEMALKIHDECSEHSDDAYWSGVATWHPWYLDEINFSNLSDAPDQDTLSVIECAGKDFYPEIVGNKLNHIYLPNTTTTLRASNSPYHVTRPVEIRENAVLNIENGVEITFDGIGGNYAYVTVMEKGILNAGCYDLNVSNITTRGTYLYDKIYIHNKSYGEAIIFESQYDTSYIAKFCNVLFEDMSALSTRSNDVMISSSANLEFTNCEFSNVGYILERNGQLFRFTNCYFHHYTGYMISNGYGETTVFENCLFERFTYSSQAVINRYSYDAQFPGVQYISNSEIIGNGISECLYLSSSVLEYSNISNCSVALQSAGDNLIRYNMIENNQIAFHINANQYSNEDTIQYNNFIHNDINIQLEGVQDCNCTYNYFENQSDVTIAGSVYDICDGYSEVLVTWQPWYRDAVNFDDLSNLPTEVTTTNNYCPGSDDYPLIIGTKLDVVYATNTITTLNATKSPYYVKSNVTIQKGAVLNIPNGAEIIFVDDFYINVEGTINAGCDPMDSFSSDHRGLYSVNNKIHIHSNRTGGINFIASNGTFCNVLFEGFDVAIRYQDINNPYVPYYNCRCLDTRSTFHHCEFSNIGTVALGYCSSCISSCSCNHWRQYFDFENSYFHDISLLNEYGITTFDNCLIEEFEVSVTKQWRGRVTVFNSDIHGDGVQECVHSVAGCAQPSTNIKNSTITNCGIGLVTNYYQDIMYNTFINNTVAIKADFDIPLCDNIQAIQYNNFLYNDINIQLRGHHCYNCSYNYFSVSSTNQSAIDATMNHVCDGYSDELVTFWPWSMEPYHHRANATRRMRTFDYIWSHQNMGCDSIHSAISYTIGTTSAPTTTISPSTAQPTTSLPTTTISPSTAQPTTSLPTTTISPSTAQPTTSLPTTTISPSTAQPTTSLPTTTISPSTAQPTTSLPTTTISPTTARPTTSVPTTVQPTTTTVTTHEPTTSIITTTIYPTTTEPTTMEPTTTSSTTMEPTTTTISTTMESTTTTSTTMEPTTTTSTAMEPTTVETTTTTPATTSLPGPASSTIATTIRSRETTFESTKITSLEPPLTSTKITAYATVHSATRNTKPITTAMKTYTTWNTESKSDALLTEDIDAGSDPNDITASGAIPKSCVYVLVMVVIHFLL